MGDIIMRGIVVSACDDGGALHDLITSLRIRTDDDHLRRHLVVTYQFNGIVTAAVLPHGGKLGWRSQEYIYTCVKEVKEWAKSWPGQVWIQEIEYGPDAEQREAVLRQTTC